MAENPYKNKLNEANNKLVDIDNNIKSLETKMYDNFQEIGSYIYLKKHFNSWGLKPFDLFDLNSRVYEKYFKHYTPAFNHLKDIRISIDEIIEKLNYNLAQKEKYQEIVDNLQIKYQEIEYLLKECGKHE